MVNDPILKEYQCTNPIPESGTHTIACWQWGSEKNPRVAVCIHGLARNARDFDFLATALSDEFRVLAIDMPGRGKSEWLTDPSWYNPTTYSADILHVLRTLKIERVDWIGTSMGGIVAMFLASQPLGLIKKLVLNDIGPYLPAPALMNIAAYVSKGGEKVFASFDEAEVFLKETYQAKWGLYSPQLWKHFAKHSLRQEENSWRLHYDPAITAGFKDEKGNIKPLESMDLWELWEKITCSVFLIRGERSEVLTCETTEKMRATCQINHFMECKECAHAPSLMEKKHINAIKNWLLTEQ